MRPPVYGTTVEPFAGACAGRGSLLASCTGIAMVVSILRAEP